MAVVVSFFLGSGSSWAATSDVGLPPLQGGDLAPSVVAERGLVGG
jgi:hypothetical protein